MPRATTLAGVPAVLALAAAGAAAGACTSSAAYTVYSENDLYAVGNRDRYYTNGLRISGLHPASATPEPVRSIAEALPALSEAATTQVGWVFGQDMYTPTNTRRDPPDPHDRPYGGWLYLGVLVSKAVRADDGPAGDHVDVLELDVGVVGPPSLAEQTQISYHHFIGSPRPQGWEYQLRFEPGVDVVYEHRNRCAAGDAPFGTEWDLLGVGGVSLGNVSTYGALGATLRWGSDLRRDFGPSTIHSTAVDVPDLGTAPPFRWFVFGGAEGRAVARNLFLDGNTFRDSPSVHREVFVGELRTGIAVEWEFLRLAYTHVVRSPEFEGQDYAQTYGSIALTFQTNF